MRSDLLHVVTVINNPMRWATRNKLFLQFVHHMLESGVNLTIVECAYGDIPHLHADLARLDPSGKRLRHVAVHAKTHLWIKENLINIGLQNLPAGWKYVAWVDADITFRRRDWAEAAVYALQHYDVIQPWSDCYDLGPNGEHVGHHLSFGRNWVEKPECIGRGAPYEFSHPGYAWAATRRALEAVGGLIETAALGAGDHHMALALVNKARHSMPGWISKAYERPIFAWQDRAQHHIAGNLGYVPGTIEHGWHGTKASRQYISRWDILMQHGFDPDVDLKRNLHGVLELAGNKPELKRAITAYFSSRNEDRNCL